MVERLQCPDCGRTSHFSVWVRKEMVYRVECVCGWSGDRGDADYDEVSIS